MLRICTISKLFFKLLVLFCSVVWISSCTTTVSIDYLVPAEHDMADYRTVELVPVPSYNMPIHETPPRKIEDMSRIAPMLVYSGYQIFSERSLAVFTDTVLRDKLLQLHYFTLFPTGANEVSAGIQPEARLQVTISTLDIDEYVFARSQQHSDSEQQFSFHLRQKVNITLTYMVLDNKDDSLLYSGNVTRRFDQIYDVDTNKGPVLFAPSLTPVCEELVNDAIEHIAEKLSPHVAHVRVSLQKDDSGSGGALFKTALQYAKDGNYEIAYQQFFHLWEKQGHVAAGYNAALLAEAIGNKTKALEIMRQVNRTGEFHKAQRQVDRMSTYLILHMEAETQL